MSLQRGGLMFVAASIASTKLLFSEELETNMTVDSAQLAVRSAASNDLHLVHACKNGDVTAFEQLVKRYDRKLLRIAQHVTHNREDSEDGGSGGVLEGLPTLGRISRGFQILKLADSHHSEPVAYEAAKAAALNKRGATGGRFSGW
jgi:hypothetical protein